MTEQEERELNEGRVKYEEIIYAEKFLNFAKQHLSGTDFRIWQDIFHLYEKEVEV